MKPTRTNPIHTQPPAPAANARQTEVSDRGEARNNNQGARADRNAARIEEAKTRTDTAEARTEPAEARNEESEIRFKLHESGDRKRSEESVRLSKARYRRLFETAQEGLLILDAPTGRVIDANPFMQLLLGYSREELIGTKFWEIDRFKGVEVTRTAFIVLQEQSHVCYENLALEPRDGRRIEVEFVRNAYVVDQRPAIQRKIRDITERKRAAGASHAGEREKRTAQGPEGNQ